MTPKTPRTQMHFQDLLESLSQLKEWWDFIYITIIIFVDIVKSVIIIFLYLNWKHISFLTVLVCNFLSEALYF